jgi:hypothetical protein
MFGRAALVGLVAVAACGSGVQPPDYGMVPLCPAQNATPLANIGPDLHLRAPCGGVVTGVVASVAELGTGSFNWNASIEGDPALQISGGFPMCTVKPEPQLATVQFVPPLSAKPGDSFDAVVTITAGDDVFPAGAVNVHAEVVQPTVTVDRSTIDFGDVSLDGHPSEMLVFRNETAAPIVVVAPASAPPFVYDQDRTSIPSGAASARRVGVFGDTPGDVTTVSVWTTTAGPDTELPEGCTGSISVSVHARLIAPDGGMQDSSADAE